MLYHFIMPFAISVLWVDQKDLADRWIICLVPCQSTSVHFQECPSPAPQHTHMYTPPLGQFLRLWKNPKEFLITQSASGCMGLWEGTEPVFWAQGIAPPSLPPLLPTDTHTDPSSFCCLVPASTQRGKETWSGSR